jgi:hypothetical protein
MFVHEDVLMYLNNLKIYFGMFNRQKNLSINLIKEIVTNVLNYSFYFNLFNFCLIFIIILSSLSNKYC